MAVFWKVFGGDFVSLTTELLQNSIASFGDLIALEGLNLPFNLIEFHLALDANGLLTSGFVGFNGGVQDMPFFKVVIFGNPPLVAEFPEWTLALGASEIGSKTTGAVCATGCSTIGADVGALGHQAERFPSHRRMTSL